jgi:DNA-binding winged helix-turn-helix (wHTH) protein/tetratricopeptide (TPR) repeat protein
LGHSEHSAPRRGIDLAAEPDFRLGDLIVSPSTSRVRAGGVENRVEPRVMQALVALVRSEGRTVSRDQLVELCWDGRIVSDDAISRTVAKVRQLTQLVEPPPFKLETVPKIGFVLTAAEGTGAADKEAAAAKAVQQAGLQKQESPEKSRVAGWLGSRALLAVLVVVATAMAGLTWLLAGGVDRSSQNPKGSVNVVVVQRGEPNSELADFSARVSDTLVDLLLDAGIETHHPMPGAQPTDAGPSEFNLAVVVSGDSSAPVIHVQTIDSESGVIVWSAKFERPPDRVRGLDAEVAYGVAGVLRCALDEREAARELFGTEILSLFLAACDAGIRGWADGLEPTRRLAEAAPNVAGAHGFRALAASFLVEQFPNSPDQAKALSEEAMRSAREALRLDPLTPKAHGALALLLGSNSHWKEREAHLSKALELDPDLPPALIAYTVLLREVGRVRSAQEIGRRVLSSPDPRAIGIAWNISFLNAMLGDWDGAMEAEERAAMIRPGSIMRVRWTNVVWWLDPVKALPQVRPLGEDPISRSPEDGIACFEIYLRRLIDARGTPLKGLPPACESFQADWRIRLLARQGDVDGAYRLLEATPPEERRTTMFLFYPEMKSFRRDKRFMPLTESIGLLAYWRETDRWPDFCSEPDLPYDCRGYGL